MKSEDIDRALAEIVPITPDVGQVRDALLSLKSAPTKPITTVPLKDLFEQIEPLLGSENSDDAARQRNIDAREVRDRLPNFLRQGTWNELAIRVSDKRLVEAARAWAWGKSNLVFMGKTEIGKTTSAAMLFRRLLGLAVVAGGDTWADAASMQWFRATQLAISRREHQLGRGEAPEVIAASNARLLFIDDLGWEDDVAVISEIFAERYERQYPTVFTTGRTTKELWAMYGAAAARRMLEAGGKAATVVNCFPETSR